MFSKVLAAYNLNNNVAVTPFGSGLINNTWKVSSGKQDYVLQRVNNKVFIKPENIADNIRLIGEYLAQHYPGYLYTMPLKTMQGEDLFVDPEAGYFRMFPFIKDSYTINVAQAPAQAQEAAAEFGKFTRLLSGFPVEALKVTIQDFHNLSYRFSAFLVSLESGNKDRMEESKEVIQFILSQKQLVKEYEEIVSNPDFKIRVTHHDTKISNVLFDQHEKGLCVIDLDTMMPGYFISDLGDMMRTYLSPVSEEEQDFKNIEVRDDFYIAIVKGYATEMKDELTKTEKKYFVYSGKFMIYMQVLRFFTDYLNNDLYYGSNYPGHNLTRAKNQIVLLKKLSEKKYLEDVKI